MDGKTVCVQSSQFIKILEKHMSGADVKLYQAVDDHNDYCWKMWCRSCWCRINHRFYGIDGGVDVAFTGPTFSGGVFGDGVGGAAEKDTETLEMWNAAIAEMSKDGTIRNNKRVVCRDISM